MKIKQYPPFGGAIPRMAAALLMTGCMLATAGCMRTDDGTVAVARQWDVGQYWRRPPAPPQTPPVQSGTEVFPVAPATGWQKPAHSSHRKTRRQARSKTPPARPLTCHDDFHAGERARVVCQ
ncbi:MAG: hypothetical protein J0I98_20665 [Mesorhizobium sp.]|nr:hypothetical protein [Mesorhizobium sp.]MBN9245196.1 hypothetical protein [Mesorhizobium sp.]